MTVLAVDTANALCQVALLHAGEVIEAAAQQPRAHADQVLPLVDRLLARRGIRLADVERFAFGHGPGGLTGVRVAASVVQGFAYAVERPVVAVSNLQALALCLIDSGAVTPEHDGVVIAHDAGMADVCWCAYAVEDAMPRALDEERFDTAAGVALPRGRWLIGGSAAPAVGTDDNERVAAGTATRVVSGSAAAIARLAAGPQAELLPPAAAQPVYWRHPVDGRQ